MTASFPALLPALTNWWPGGGGGETPELRPGLSEADITPGIAGFLFTALMVGLAILVVRDMVKRMRRMKYHNRVESETAGEEPEFPGEITPAGISEAQQHARTAAAEARFGPNTATQTADDDPAVASQPSDSQEPREQPREPRR